MSMFTSKNREELTDDNIQGYLSVTFKIVQNMLVYFGNNQANPLNEASVGKIMQTLDTITS
jgi:hypothetical protein